MPPGTTPPYPWLEQYVSLYEAVAAAVAMESLGTVADILEENREAVEKAREELLDGA
jgi:hypothetical protein